MKKRILASIVFTIMMCMCIFSTTVNGAGITDFYTPIEQNTNKPLAHTPVTLTVNHTNFEETLERHIFQKGDKIVFNSILSSNTIYEGFQIVNGNPGTDVTGTLATISKKSEFASTIVQEITFTSEKPIILHSVSAGPLGEPVNGVSHRALYIRYGVYEEYYPIEYKKEEGVVLQYGGPQIDKAYITDDYYIIKFYDTYAKEGNHFNGISIISQTSQDFESVWLDPNTNPSSGGITTLKTRVKTKPTTDGQITKGKMIVDISMTKGYTLKLDANGGKIDYLDSKIFEIEKKISDIKISDYNTPVREGYTFDGWYIDSECTKPAPAATSFDDEIYYERIAEDVYNMTYYAKWIPTNVFTITKSSTENGTFTVDKEVAAKNETVTITATPNEGYKVKSVKVNNSENGITANNTNYTFKMPENNVTVTVEFELIETETDTKKTINKTEDDLTVSITGTFAGNPVLTIEETKTGNEGYNSLITIVKDDKVVIGSYDISITGGTYEGNLEITFKIGKQYEGDKVTIYHKKASGEIETFETTVKDGKATITVTELSPFMLTIDKEVVEKKDITPKTGINLYTYTVLIVIAIIGIFYSKQVNKKDR